MSRPNILLIMTDQQRFDSLGCYGASWVQTPNIDRLAEQGVVFENCYVNNTICTPSRASMLTGKHLPGHGVYQLHDILPDDEILFTKHLQDAGYQTALFGKLHVSGRLDEEKRRHPNDGFDIYEWCMEVSLSMDSPYNGYSKWLKEQDPDFHAKLKEQGRKLLHIPRKYHFTHWAAERTIDFIENRTSAKPFFCMMSVFDPHNPYFDYPEGYEKRVDTSKMPMNKVTEEERQFHIRGLQQEQRDGYFGQFDLIGDDDMRKMRIGYYASIALIDDEVGRVLAALDKKDIADNTIVMLVSDHGDMLGDHGLMVKGAYFYNPCVKVPMIMRYPKEILPGKRISELVQPHDIAATALKAAGCFDDSLRNSMPDSLDMVSVAAGKKGHGEAVCAYRNTGISNDGKYFDPPINATMIANQKYKLNIYHPESGIDEDVTGQLFDLENDPAEINNLWDKLPEVRLMLTEKLMDWFYREEAKSGLRSEAAIPAKDHLMSNKYSSSRKSAKNSL